MKVFLIAVMSANGKISRSESSPVDWNSREDLEWFKSITMKIGNVIMGRRTFDLIGKPLSDRLNVVMTHKVPSSKMENVIFSDEKPREILKKLENSYSKAAVIGGKEIFTLFLKEDLIDEMYITYEPILIDGMGMLGNIEKDVNLKVIDVKNLHSGSLIVHYKVKKGEK